MAKKPDGYMVFESCEDYEQALGLEVGDKIPFSAGLLTWQSEDAPAALFLTRKQARQAIARTEHFRRAKLLGLASDQLDGEIMPNARDCKVVPVVHAFYIPEKVSDP